MEIIKLVIWDLDDTFWKGTIAEGEIEIINENISIVKELTRRGIMNSIASKNSFDIVKGKLLELGVWDYFIFPSISWEPKGLQIKMIIENAQLRNVNVLFIDDNHLNLEEVKFYNKGINVSPPEIISGLLSNDFFLGKDDSKLTRLKQYKLLEKKNISRSSSTNEEFLKSSNIQIELISDLPQIRDRIEELINRTNQLNFTKKRLTQSEIDQLLAEKSRRQGAIRVVDRFGDYGVVGYYCFDQSNKALEHFIFSCRILNIGIEQFMYSFLAFPKLEIVGEVIAKLNNSDFPEWITIVTHNSKAKTQKESVIKILFKGGCDMSQMLHYIRKERISIIEETNGISKNNVPIHTEHTEILLGANKLNESEQKELTETIPFVDKHFFETQMFSEKYDVIIYSVLMDYTQDLYVRKTDQFVVPFGGYRYNLTDENQHKEIEAIFAKRGIASINVQFLKSFSKEYSYLGQITPERFKSNLSALRSRIPVNIPIIFLNGCEIDLPESGESNAKDRHILMNGAMDEFVSDKTNNSYLVDLRKIVDRRDQLGNSIRHYVRDIYFEIASELKELMENEIGLELRVKKDSILRDLNFRLRSGIRQIVKKINKVIKENN